MSIRKSGEIISQRDYSIFYMYETATYTWLYQYLTENVGVIATSERSFSAMRRVKSYLRSTMGNERLPNLLLMHIHRHVQVDLDMIIDNFSKTYSGEKHGVREQTTRQISLCLYFFSIILATPLYVTKLMYKLY